ncbi:Scr1 family TA system antitoxin-like transcriptional regulator [Amycolatopsis sp. cmx-4-61]|uniref:Scr1 family TA system antitoxin-like transcriptional regulator n=1 Tax=Amycolatopsis sp. cmx-4-61 TaxID=2790937 RepID=UPI00397A153E
MPLEQSPAIMRRWVRSQLRSRREAVDLDQKDAATALGSAPSRVSHLESGRNLPDLPSLKVLFSLYKCPGDVDSFWDTIKKIKAAEKASGKDRVQLASDKDPSDFDVFVTLEDGAAEKHSADLIVLNGLAQVAGYIEPLLRFYDPTATEDEIRQRCELRLQRQNSVTRTHQPLALLMFAPEHLLIERIGGVGGPEVMRRQLEHLLELMTLPHVDFRVLSHEARARQATASAEQPAAKQDGGHRAVHGPFEILKFGISEDPGCVYIDTAPKGIFYEKVAEITQYEGIIGRLDAVASPKAESRVLIERHRKDLM